MRHSNGIRRAALATTAVTAVAAAVTGILPGTAMAASTTTGKAATVTVRPHGKAWVKLTFVQVQGEGDGYCKSGKTPKAFPTMVIGLPHSGKHQVALNDGWWAECDNKVTVTPVSSVKPS
ncbi:DUF4232 domain-containing protein [Streptomyces europaeiscabiei]|uniref:DUF4232 domain-containing protein n=1 Tax=Streptomyces europaeiscabiei TaxID=146819 RepID=UPI0029AF9EBC|nr:DUF4232 domain-containing protein [Streptomyces europaeiscabiei]MDX2760777.1 DUF4232 domain-containing protein [Streptomyces europaeiscabiei]